MKPSNKKTIIIGVVIIVIAAMIAAAVLFLPKNSLAPTQQSAVTTPGTGNNQIAAVTTSTRPVKMAPIPQGSQTYPIMQAAGLLPKIVQATVNPVSAHVGDTQTLTIIVSDPNPVTSVVAVTRTDNETTTIPLALVGPAALNEIVPQKYFVNAQNQLALVNPNKNTTSNSNIAQAAQGDEKYSATWTVKDTHIARYYTTFTVMDAKNNVNSIQLTWTDAICLWGSNNYGGGNVSVSSAFGSRGCTFSGPINGNSNPIDGPENANLVVDAPIILSASTTLVFNTGKAISFSGSGYISLLYPTSQIVPSEMYCASSSWVTSFSNPADGTYQVPRSSLSNSVFPGQTAYFTSPTITNYGTSTYNYSCASAISYQYTTSTVVNNQVCAANACPPTQSCTTGSTTQSSLGYTPSCGQTFSAGTMCTGVLPATVYCGALNQFVATCVSTTTGSQASQGCN